MPTYSAALFGFASRAASSMTSQPIANCWTQ